MGDDKRAQIISLIRDTIRASEPTAQIILSSSISNDEQKDFFSAVDFQMYFKESLGSEKVIIFSDSNFLSLRIEE